jgi:seryl-tRNA synthetase
MLEIQRIRNEKESVIEGLKKRHFDASSIVEEVLRLDELWRSKKSELEVISSQLNQIAKEIGALFQQGKQDAANLAK